MSDQREPIHEETARYGLIARSAPLAKGELEVARLTTEVIVCWKELTCVLSVTHVDAQGRFVLGEGKADFLMDAGLLGTTRFTLVENGRLALPECATGTLHLDGLEQDFVGVQLTEGVEAFVELGDFRIVVRGVHAGQRVAPRGGAFDKPPLFFVGGTMAVAGMLLAIMSLLPPHGMALTFDNIERDSRLVSFVINANTLEEPEVAVRAVSEAGEPGHAEWGNAGRMGEISATETARVSATQGDVVREAPQIARETARTSVQNSAVLDAFRSAIGNLGGQASPYGAAHNIGADSANALGALTGTLIGESQGFGGLGLSGTGRHAGGDGGGTVGLGERGSERSASCSSGGPCAGGGLGRSGRAGSAIGQLSNIDELPERTARVPRVRFCGCGPMNVVGALSRAVVRREVRRHRNEMKSCYQQALISNPSLEGRVTTHFTISPNGSVIAVDIRNSTLHHTATEMCIRRVIQRFSFPAPDGAGIVGVTYPFTFSTR